MNQTTGFTVGACRLVHWIACLERLGRCRKEKPPNQMPVTLSWGYFVVTLLACL